MLYILSKIKLNQVNLQNKELLVNLALKHGVLDRKSGTFQALVKLLSPLWTLGSGERVN